MTWHLGARLSALLGVVFLIGCGSSSGKRAKIELIAPDDKAELTIEDDTDPDTVGVQYEVRAKTQNIRPDTVMLLVIAGENTTNFTEVDDDGMVVFENATLPPGPHSFHINTATGNASSDEYSYTLKTLVIETPRDGVDIAFGDDVDPDRDGLQINVTVRAYAIDLNEDIELEVDGQIVGDPVSPTSNGTAVFRGVTLSSGSHRLKAIAGIVESSVSEIGVNSACASVSYVSPEFDADQDRLTLAGGDDECPENGADYTVDVVVSTDAGEGREVELLVNNSTKLRTLVRGSLARFDDVVLNRRMSANEVSVSVTGAEGVTCAPVPFPKPIYVDCEGSDCSIGSPVPFSGEDGFYLNRSMLDGGGFAIRVDSDSGVIGRNLELIVDGRDGQSVLEEAAEPSSGRVSATFSGIELSQGTHTIEARCRDASGNITESGEVSWIVDTEACGVTLTDPAADALYLPADDRDGSADGVQVDVAASVEGSDCYQVRAGVCDPEEGIADGPFGPLSGGSVATQITLAESTRQNVCVEVRDNADNIGLGNSAVSFRTTVPSVQIESPADLASFNAQGNDGKTADSNNVTPACNADFSVLCTEIGAAVQLRHGDENGPMFATGTCEAPADGDLVLPEGFEGRAQLEDVAFLPTGQDSTTVIATQVLMSGSNQLLGKSAVISLTGWCEAPGVTLFPGCPDPQLELPNSGNVVVPLVRAIYNGATPARAPSMASLRVTDPGGGEISTQTVNLMNGSYRFTNVDLGDDEQAVETRISLTDTYANTTTVTCQTTLVGDLPALTISSPAPGAVFGAGDSCDPGVPLTYGVEVSILLDQTGDRELGYSVNGGALESVTIDDTDMDLCIPVADGANTIVLQLDSTLGVGVAKPSINIAVDTIQIVEPAEEAVLLPADDYCGDDFGAHVVVDVAPAFEGEAVTVSGGANSVPETVTGGQVDTCLPLAQGRGTVTVSLDGTQISRSVDVTVITGGPSNPLQLTGITLPSGGSYRSGPVSVGWAAPQVDFDGQLLGYELRCAATAITGSASEQDRETWWDGATEFPLGDNGVPPATNASFDIRIGETFNCVLRGRDAADQLSPVPDSAPLSYPFREVRVDVSDATSMGYAIASIGDVNDDNVNDILVGGSGRAYLYFGNSGGLAAKPNANAPDVTFVGTAGTYQYNFGSRVVALGDINGDGENDFAIAHPTYGSVNGAVYLFYGRKAGDAWPTTVTLTSDAATDCGADVCFVGDLASEVLGYALAPAGDYNNDGRPDIAIGAPGRPQPGDNFAGRLYVLLGRAFEGTGGTRPTTPPFWKIGLRLPSGDPLGFYVDGVGQTGNAQTSNSQVGNAVASVGNVDGTAGADLLTNAAGNSNTSILSKLYFLSGRPHNGSAPRLRSIANSALELKDSGATNAFAVRLAPMRNWYNDTEMGVADVAVFSAGDDFHVYLGDENGSSERFANDTRITVTGVSGSQFGNSGIGASRGYNPNISTMSRSDLNRDGLDDLCIGTGNGARPIYVFYGDVAADDIASRTIGFASASQINPTPRAGTTARVVQPVGDLTGDGVVDLVVGEPNANSNAGGITILY